MPEVVREDDRFVEALRASFVTLRQEGDVCMGHVRSCYTSSELFLRRAIGSVIWFTGTGGASETRARVRFYGEDKVRKLADHILVTYLMPV